MNYKHYSVTNHIHDVRLSVTVTEGDLNTSVAVRFGNSSKVTYHSTWGVAQEFAQRLVSEYALHGYNNTLNGVLES